MVPRTVIILGALLTALGSPLGGNVGAVGPAPQERSTRGATFPPVAPPAAFTEVAPPPGASTNPPADGWYRAPTGDGHSVELAVYLPATHPISDPITVVVLHGGNGLHRSMETLARSYAEEGFVGIAACWFDEPDALVTDYSVSCSGGPAFKGTEAAVSVDVDTVIAAAKQVPAVDPSRIAIFGHSYGAGAALMRAADRGAVEPIMSVGGLLARVPNCCGTRAGDRYPNDVAGAIHGPVLVAHATGDGITPVGQAEVFAAAMRDAGNPVSFPSLMRYYPAPAGHTLPYQVDELAGTTVAAQFLADSSAWIRLQLPVEPQTMTRFW